MLAGVGQSLAPAHQQMLRVRDSATHRFDAQSALTLQELPTDRLALADAVSAPFARPIAPSAAAPRPFNASRRVRSKANRFTNSSNRC
jgi:hypothetical protein